jgi:hypothetical protein
MPVLESPSYRYARSRFSLRAIRIPDLLTDPPMFPDFLSFRWDEFTGDFVTELI